MPSKQFTRHFDSLSNKSTLHKVIERESRDLTMSSQEKWGGRLVLVVRHCWDLGLLSHSYYIRTDIFDRIHEFRGTECFAFESSGSTDFQVHFSILHIRFVQSLKWINEQVVTVYPVGY